MNFHFINNFLFKFLKIKSYRIVSQYINHEPTHAMAFLENDIFFAIPHDRILNYYLYKSS